ncbi:MAG TPA: TIGR03761 family integrating conjugative element protein [Gammaproteobacteria bacterium]|nr:TIGR03761 family integrating conjugative element protein [Gammaproteobacteria bacterium]
MEKTRPETNRPSAARPAAKPVRTTLTLSGDEPRLPNGEIDFNHPYFDDAFEEDDTPRKLDLPDNADPLVPWSDIVKRPGQTITEGEITLHTRLAHRLFYGRKGGDGVEPVIGLVRFVSNLNTICAAAMQDDPYADQRMIEIETLMQNVKAFMKEELVTLNALLDSGSERRVKVKSIGSQEPATFRLKFQYSYGFLACDLLGLFDELANTALAAQHVGRLFAGDWTRTVGAAGRKMRHLFYRSTGFRYSGVCRDDFAANNAKARAVVAKYGEPPADILRGDRRPRWLPRRKPGEGKHA